MGIQEALKCYIVAIPKDWTEIFTFSKDYSKDLEIVPHLLEFEFRSNLLLSIASVVDMPPTWRRAGFLQKYVNHDDYGMIRLEQEAILLEPMLVRWQTDDLPYLLRFNAEHWMQQVTIKFYRPDPQIIVIPNP